MDTKSGKNNLDWRDLSDLFSTLNEKDKSSWCIENEDDTCPDANHPGVFLQQHDTNTNANANTNANTDQKRGYCSFILQNDKPILKQTLSRLPHTHLPILSSSSSSPSSSPKLEQSFEMST